MHDEEKGLVFSPDFYGEKINQYLNKLIDWKTGNDVYCNEDMVYKEIFAAERSLFCIDRAYLAAQHLVNSEIKYGVLPLPKWDEAQEKYISGMANPITLYCVSAYSVDPDRAAAVMECLAVEGYKNTTPALFEEFFKARYADEEIDAQMFDLIRETIHYQIGRIFTDQITGWMVFFNQYCVNNRNWNSTWASNKGVAEATLRRFLEALENG